MRCRIEQYAPPDAGGLPAGDWGRLQSAAEEHRAAIQRAWDGSGSPCPIVIGQPSVYHFRVGREADGGFRLVYRDALAAQLGEIRAHLDAGIRVIPMVLCDMNVLTVSSLFDPELLPSDDLDDANVLPCLGSRLDVERLSAPDFRGGLMPFVLSETRRLRALLPAWLPVGVRLNTGPLSLAAELRGATALLEDMMEAPDVYRHLLSILTDAYIGVRDRIHEAAGIRVSAREIRPDVSFHAPTTGIMLCDDLVSVLGPREFERFALPYLTRVLGRYGGGTLHSCGSIGHLLPILAGVPEVVGVEFGQGDLVDWEAARRQLPGRALAFWDLGQEGTSYLDRAAEAACRPRTFIYTQNTEHARYWARWKP
jgi:hypothetical protein